MFKKNIIQANKNEKYILYSLEPKGNVGEKIVGNDYVIKTWRPSIIKVKPKGGVMPIKFCKKDMGFVL